MTFYLPSYASAVRTYRYDHYISQRLAGVRFNHTKAHRVYDDKEDQAAIRRRKTKNLRREERRDLLKADTRIFHIKTGLYFHFDVSDAVHEPLEAAVHPLYPDLEEQYWFIDPNRYLQRKRNPGLICVYDLIHILCFRKPPPGPFFFMPESKEWFEQLKVFFKDYDFSQPLSKQFYWLEQPNGESLRAQHYFSGTFPESHYLQSVNLSHVWWFNPKNPYITWVPETCRWRLYYYDTTSKKFIRGEYSAWKYWKAQARLYQFINEDLKIPESKQPPELINAYDRSWHYWPRHADDNKPNRFWYNFDRHKPRDQLVMGEHPRDPYWNDAFHDYMNLKLGRTTNDNDDFASLVEDKTSYD